VEKSVTFDARLEFGATFRFPVTWSYLTATPPAASPTTVAAPLPKARTLEVVDLPPVKAPPPPPPAIEKTVQTPPLETAAGVVALLPVQNPVPNPVQSPAQRI